MATSIQSSFAKGEIGPQLFGRVDTQMYTAALRTARNVVVRSTGGACNRAGLLWVGPVRDHTYAPRLVQFQFKTSDAYELEFGDFYLRVIRGDGHVTETPGNITAISNSNPCSITQPMHGYVTGDEIFLDGATGMVRLNGRRILATVTGPNSYDAHDQVTFAPIDSTSFGTYTGNGTGARVYTAASPYAIADLPQVKFVQSADVMTLTHTSYPPYQLRRTGDASWTFAVPAFEPSMDFPLNQTVTVNGSAGSTTRSYRVTATDAETGEESLPALNATAKSITGASQANPCIIIAPAHGLTGLDEFQVDLIVGMTELNGRRFVAASVTTNTITLQGEDATAYGTYASGGIIRQTFVRITNGNATANDTIAFLKVDGADHYSLYLNQNGVYGWLGDTNTLTFTNSNIAPENSISPPASRNPFIGAGNYPGAVSFYEQRMVFANTTNRPDTEFFSRVAAYTNMSTSSPGQDDDAITATLNSQEVNEIRHFLPGTDLLVLTSGGEWQVNAGQDSFFSSTTLKQFPQSSFGCSHTRPLVIGRTGLYVTENRVQIRTLTWNWQVNGYQGEDLTVLAPHLFEKYQIKDMALAKYPDPIVHVVRDDGQVCCMTYNQEQQMVAWTRWDTNGKFEQVSALRHSPSEIDEAVYFVVRRRINGNIVRYIERTHSRRFDDVRDCFFVDAGISYDNPIPITGVSNDSNTIVTAPDHGLTTGSLVDFFDIVFETTMDNLGNEIIPDQMNYRRFQVGNTTEDTFELLHEDGTLVNSIAWAVYLEGGVVRFAAQTISGLDHLEGQQVVALADGDVIKGLTVTNGSLTLSRRFGRVHIGLPFVSDIETLDIDAPEPGGGTSQGAFKKVADLTIRFEKSRGLLYGPSVVPERGALQTDLYEIKDREFETFGSPTNLTTGDKFVTMSPDWNTNGRIFIRQINPLPMHILAVIPNRNEE